MRRLLAIVAMGLSLSACVPYYSGYGGYRSDIYVEPSPYYYRDYRPHYVYPRDYYVPPPRYYREPRGYYQEPGYRHGHGDGDGHGHGHGHGWREDR